jgi:antitoxin (DNA-binding transcriptional repressor) of toxin-antitoxin stability system
VAINMFEAKSQLSRLVELVESGAEAEIVIARNGKPAAKLVPMTYRLAGTRIGVAEGQFLVPDDLDGENEMIAALIGGLR